MTIAGRISLPATGGSRRLVVALSAATFLLWVGAGAIVPLLPSYLRAKGASPAIVGVIMGAYFAASVVTQYPAGRLADGLGPRAVVSAGLVLFAAASAGFAFLTSPVGAVSFRALQGVGAGAVTVAAAAAIGALVPPGERGGAFGALYGSQMLALAVGPLLGSLVGAASMRLLFLGAGGLALAGMLPLLGVLRGAETRAEVARAPRVAPVEPPPQLARRTTAAGADAGRLTARAALLGVALAFGATGLLTGVYESCWTLLLRLRGATTFEIGLSWTLFALPYAALSVPAGRLAERADRRLLTIVALLSSAGFCALYPTLQAVGLLVGLGVAEAAGSVVGSPPAVLVLSSAVPADRQGGAQGMVETARTASTALAAAGSGALFGLAPVLPFALAAGLVALSCVAIAWVWRGPRRPVAFRPSWTGSIGPGRRRSAGTRASSSAASSSAATAGAGSSASRPPTWRRRARRCLGRTSFPTASTREPCAEPTGRC